MSENYQKKGYKMKLKFMLVAVAVFGLLVRSYADCSKYQILKLKNTGFTKTEINGICGKSEIKKEKLKWVKPSAKVCKANGGHMDGDQCRSNWSNAKNICSASGGRLATIDELKKVVTYCSGTIYYSVCPHYHDEVDTISKSCYKKKGFTPGGYWSSTDVYYRPDSLAWGIGLGGNNSCVSEGLKPYSVAVYCVKTGE